MCMMKHDGRWVKMMDDESLEFTKDKIFMMIMIMTFLFFRRNSIFPYELY